MADPHETAPRLAKARDQRVAVVDARRVANQRLAQLPDELMDRVLAAKREGQAVPAFIAAALENELARGPLAGTPYRRPSRDVRPWATAEEPPASRARARARIDGGHISIEVGDDKP